MNIELAVMVGFVVYSFINFVKYLAGGEGGRAGLQAVVWLAGVAAVFLLSHGDVTGGYQVNGTALVDMNAADKVIFGIIASSIFATGFDKLLAAIDNTRSSGVSNPFSRSDSVLVEDNAVRTSAPSSTPQATRR